MKTRVLSGLIMLPLLIILYLGGYVLFGACLIIGIMGVKEFFNGFKAIDIKPNFAVACISAVGLYAVNFFTDGQKEWYMLWFFGIVLLSLLYLFNIEHRKLEDAMATVTGIFYVVFFSFHVTLVDQTDYALMVWLIVITAFGTDIMAYFSGYLLGLSLIHIFASEIFIPLTVGGGINTLEDFDRVLKCGADKVSVNSGAIKNPDIIERAAKKYGDQCVVLSMDIKRVDGDFKLFAKGGRENTGVDALQWAKDGVERGAGELVVNSIDTDGVKGGFDLELQSEIAARVNVPIIASGGAGKMEDFSDLFKHCLLYTSWMCCLFTMKMKN